MVKQLNKKLEDHRTALRNVRRDGNDHLKKLAKDKKIGKDEEKRAQDEVQGMLNDEIRRMEEAAKTEGSRTSCRFERRAGCFRKKPPAWANPVRFREVLFASTVLKGGLRILARRCAAIVSIVCIRVSIHAFEWENRLPPIPQRVSRPWFGQLAELRQFRLERRLQLIRNPDSPPERSYCFWNRSTGWARGLGGDFRRGGKAGSGGDESG